MIEIKQKHDLIRKQNETGVDLSIEIEKLDIIIREKTNNEIRRLNAFNEKKEIVSKYNLESINNKIKSIKIIKKLSKHQKQLEV